MRVRILRPSQGIVDGVSLSRLLPSLSYDVPFSLGIWLISQGIADHDGFPTVGEVVPLDDEVPALTGGVIVVQTERRNDEPER